MTPLVLGTAGHVDHGKTALVAALTGVDTDRLPEEKQRGISIELGFAQLTLPSGTVSLVDVPGHERFVRHMVAGASGIDGYLLCVAADDGVMPQTREHLMVLDLLGVRDGVVAITKSDLAAAQPAAAEVRDLVGDGVEIVPVATPAGQGLPELLGALERLVARVRRRTADGPARLFVDRAFSVAGAGTVVTGTLWGSALSAGDRVAIHPSGAAGRVRAIQVHEADTAHASGGRVALNIAGIHRDQAPRGSVVLAQSAPWQATERLDVAMEWRDETDLTSRRRLQVFHGTAEIAATCVLLEHEALRPGERGYVQLRLERSVMALAGDPLVLRSAERRTVGGAVVIDPTPAKHGRGARVGERLRVLERGDPVAVLRLRLDEAGGDGLPRGAATEQTIGAAGGVIVGERIIAARHLPDRAPSPPGPEVATHPAATAVHAALSAGGLAPPSVGELARGLGLGEGEVGDALAALARSGTAVHVGEVWFAAEALSAAVDQAVAALRAAPLGIGQLRDLWGVGRRHALAIAAHMDRLGLTRRVGDQRVLRRSAGGA